MSRFLAVIACFICLSSPAAFSLPEAEHFYPNAPIVWAVTNSLPLSVEVYETAQTNFSASVLSNAMTMGAFKPLDMTAQSKDMVAFEFRNDRVLIRSLRISQTQGTIEYVNSRTNWSSFHGVPSFDETKCLAFDYLHRFGGDTNQVSYKPSPRTEQTVETYNRPNGMMTNKAVSIRGIMLCRAMDGIDFSDSFWIEFGNDASVTMLRMHWRFLKPHQKVKALTKDEMIDAINSGKAVILPNFNGDGIPAKTKTFTITKATPIYRFKSQQALVSPSVDFEVVSDIGKPNAATNYLECPFVPKILDH